MYLESHCVTWPKIKISTVCPPISYPGDGVITHNYPSASGNLSFFSRLYKLFFWRTGSIYSQLQRSTVNADATPCINTIYPQ